MIPIKLSQLPQFTGDSSGSYIVINDSNNAVTYIVNKESFFTASLHGTASVALTALSLSGSVENAVSASYATTSSFSLTATSSSFSGFAVTASHALSVSGTVANAVSSSYAFTASYALNAGGGAGFPFSGSAVITGSLLVSGAFVDFSSVASVLASITGSLLGSASYSQNSLSASFSNNSNFAVSASHSVSSSYALSSSVSRDAENSQLLRGLDPGALIKTGSSGTTQTISGSLIINEGLTVYGSASIVNVTSSELNIGTNLITVNTQNPSFRFGGLAVIDSGSSPQESGSILYDSVQDEWIFVHRGASSVVTSSHFMMGPETYGDVGNELYIPANSLVRSVGNEHMTGSNVYDDGSNVQITSAQVSVDGDLTVTGSLFSQGGFTGSLEGSSSYALTASYALNGGGGGAGFPFSGSAVITGSLFVSESFVDFTSASYVLINSTGSLFGTASYASSVLSASYSVTSSYSLDVNLTGSNGVSRSGSTLQLGGALENITNLYTTIAGAVDLDYGGPYTASFDNSWSKGAVVEDPVTKKIYVGGFFVSSSGVPVGKSLIRLNQDFSVDPSFNVGVGIAGGGELVRKIIVDKPNSKVYVGGQFLQYSGSTVNHFMRLNEDGTIDTSFNTGGGFANGSGTVAQQGVYDMVLDANGKFVVTGLFRSYSGSAAGTDANVIRVNSDGSKDSTFNNSVGLNAAGTGLTLDQSGNIYVVGQFTTYKGSGASRIVGINTDGSRNTSFNIGAGIGTASPNPNILSTADDKLILTGNFTLYSGSSVNRIVKINLNGTIDTSFDVGAGFSAQPYIQAVDTKNRSYVGSVTAGLTYKGTTAPAGIMRILPNGSLDTSFNASGAGFSGSQVWMYIYSVYITSSNDYALVAGRFQYYNNVSSSGLIRIKTDDAYLNVTGSPVNYGADYSPLYTSRSLVDRGYVDNRLTGSLFLTGSVNVSGSITGSLFGTSSWSQNSITASFVQISQTASFVATSSWAQNAVTASFVGLSQTASFVATASWSQNAVSSSLAQNSVTASYVLSAISSSYSLTSSYSFNAESSSHSATASSADNLVVRGDVTGSNALFTGTVNAQNLVVQVIVSSSTDFSSGSTIFGNSLSNTHQFTGSILVTGSLNATSSWSQTAVTVQDQNFAIVYAIAL